MKNLETTIYVLVCTMVGIFLPSLFQTLCCDTMSQPCSHGFLGHWDKMSSTGWVLSILFIGFLNLLAIHVTTTDPELEALKQLCEALNSKYFESEGFDSPPRYVIVGNKIYNKEKDTFFNLFDYETGIVEPNTI